MQVSWFPIELLSAPGRLGLTDIPGGRARSTQEDLQSLQAAQVTHLVCLVEAHELRFMTPAETPGDRQRTVEAHDMVFRHHAIEDFKAPELAATCATIDFIDGALRRGSTVVVHCWAGLGRAGTMAACLLVHRGMTAHGAIQAVRWVRPGAVQSEIQEQFIAAFEAHARAAGRS